MIALKIPPFQLNQLLYASDVLTNPVRSAVWTLAGLFSVLSDQFWIILTGSYKLTVSGNRVFDQTCMYESAISKSGEDVGRTDSSLVLYGGSLLLFRWTLDLICLTNLLILTGHCIYFTYVLYVRHVACAPLGHWVLVVLLGFCDFTSPRRYRDSTSGSFVY